MSHIKSILFDLGNVLAYIDFDAFWRSLGYYQPKEIAPFKDGYNVWTFRYETGNISTDEYLKRLQSVFNNRFTLAQLKHAFGSIILDPVDGMKEIVKKVSQTHRTALVSNTNEIHYTMSRAKFDVLKMLPKHYLSFRLHVMKPAKEFYTAIIKDEGIIASEILFIDDKIENIEGALLVGMKAIKFENVSQIEMALKTFTLIP